MTGNLLHINYSLWVFLLDKLDYGWYVTCGVYVKNKVGRTFTPGENGKKKRITSAKANYRDFVSEWHYEDECFVWRVVIPSGFARVEFPLVNGQKTIEINDIAFDRKALQGEISGDKMVFELAEGEYVIKGWS